MESGYYSNLLVLSLHVNHHFILTPWRSEKQGQTEETLVPELDDQLSEDLESNTEQNSGTDLYASEQ